MHPLLPIPAHRYNNNARLVTVTSPLSSAVQNTAYEYNARGERVGIADATGSRVVLQYDHNGNNTATINRNLGAFGSTYYDDNRVWARHTPTGKTTTQTYTRSGLAASVSAPSGQLTTFGYDDPARLNSKTDPVGTSSYTYDQNNNLLTHTENGKTITRAYDELNRLTSYTDENNNTIGYQYDNNGNLTRLTYPGGSKYVNYGYDSNNR